MSKHVRMKIYHTLLIFGHMYLMYTTLEKTLILELLKFHQSNSQWFRVRFHRVQVKQEWFQSQFSFTKLNPLLQLQLTSLYQNLMVWS